MLVPIFKRILPKTLLKWATPQSKLATKFRTKRSTTTTPSINNNGIIEPLRIKTLKLAKQYSYFSGALTSLYLTILIIARICLNIVIKNLSSLMNDIRTKSRYLTKKARNGNGNGSASSQLQSQSSSSGPLSLSSSSIDTKHFTNNYKNNHRTYDNSGKSHKVFLHYTPRDPRLRIFSNQEERLSPLFNKHLVALESESELKITEDLCNYGELIGGSGSGSGSASGDSDGDSDSFGVIHKDNNKRFVCNNNNNSNNKKSYRASDLYKVYRNISTIDYSSFVKLSDKSYHRYTARGNCEKLPEKQQTQTQENQLLKSCVRQDRIRNVRNLDLAAIEGIFTISLSY